ncbi:hypothetical protein MASR2M78_33050 [Treponema sp.]
MEDTMLCISVSDNGNGLGTRSGKQAADDWGHSLKHFIQKPDRKPTGWTLRSIKDFGGLVHELSFPLDQGLEVSNTEELLSSS